MHNDHPTDAECDDQAVAFDILQVHITTLDQLLHNMADIDDMVDDQTAAAKKADRDARDATAASGLTSSRRSFSPAAMQQHQMIEEQMADFLASAPDLARHLARWQSEDAKT